jgi:hypothetical protein
MCIRKFNASGEALGKCIYLKLNQPHITEQNIKILPVQAVKEYRRNRCTRSVPKVMRMI